MRLALLATAMLAAATALAEGPNLLANPGFEEGDLSGWTTWGQVDGVQTGPWFGGIEAHSGDYFEGSAANWGTKNGGLYQRVAVQPGQTYVGRVWSCLYWIGGTEADTRSRIGLDPTGGTNPGAGSVIWSEWDTWGEEGTPQHWEELSVEAAASGAYMTLFLEFEQNLVANPPGGQWHINCFDDAELRTTGPILTTSPPGWLRAGWNLVSVPNEPVDPEAESVFADLVAAGNYLPHNLFGYEPGGGYSTYPEDFTAVATGKGYWLKLSTGAENTYVGTPHTSDQVLPLAHGWSLVGHPFDTPRLWATCKVTDGVITYYVGEAPGSWLQPLIYYYDGSYKTVAPDGSGDETHLYPWHGYWVRAMRPGLSLIIPAEVMPPPTEFVSASGGTFWLHGEEFRFIGANIRGMTHYGEGDILPYSDASHRALNCDALRNEMNGRVARVFVSCRYASPTETGNRLQETIEVAEQYDIYLIAAFTDMYSTGMNPQGDDVYYTQPGSVGPMLDHAFFSGGYTVNYLPQVEYLVERFKNEPRIFAWELGNEIRDITSPTTFITFCETVHDAIRAIDQNHMIAVGTSCGMSGFTYAQAVSLFDDRFDFLVGHPYNGSDWEDDTDIADAVGKPFLVEEAGFDSGIFPDRPASTDADVAKWIGRGADGYMQWGLMASPYDNGDGDRTFGVDRVWHTDWDGYSAVYTYWGNLLGGL